MEKFKRSSFYDFKYYADLINYCSLPCVCAVWIPGVWIRHNFLLPNIFHLNEERLFQQKVFCAVLHMKLTLGVGGKYVKQKGKIQWRQITSTSGRWATVRTQPNLGIVINQVTPL